jgi:hypothetical protein
MFFLFWQNNTIDSTGGMLWDVGGVHLFPGKIAQLKEAK